MDGISHLFYSEQLLVLPLSQPLSCHSHNKAQRSEWHWAVLALQNQSQTPIGSKRIPFITARLNDARREPTRGRWMSLLPHARSAVPGRTSGGSCKEKCCHRGKAKTAERGEESCLVFQSSVQKKKWDCKKQGGHFALGSLLPESDVSSILHLSCCACRWEHTMLHPGTWTATKPITTSNIQRLIISTAILLKTESNDLASLGFINLLTLPLESFVSVARDQQNDKPEIWPCAFSISQVTLNLPFLS